MQSLHPFRAAQSTSMSKNFPIPIVIALTTVHSAMRQTLYGRMAFIAAPWWTCNTTDPQTLWFSTAANSVPATPASRHKVEPADVTQAINARGGRLRYGELRQELMQQTECSKRTAQLAISQACKQGDIVHNDGQYRLPL